jgi:hypothetical protein
MKKHSLLGAAALSTMAFAGVANAQSLAPSANAGATVTAARVIATESALTTAQRTGVVGLSYTVGAGTPAALSKLTVALSGGATFSGPFNITQLATNACTPLVTLSTGGAKGDSSATFLVENMNECTTAPLAFNVPVLLSSTPASVNVATSLTTEAGTPIAAGTATTATGGVDLISFDRAITIDGSADTTATRATIASDFLALTGDNVIGEAEITIADDRFLGINNADELEATDYESVEFTVNGDLTNLDVEVDGEAVVEGSTPNEGVAVITPARDGTFEVTVAPNGEVITGSTYSMRARLVAPATGAVVRTVGSGVVQLETVTREGAQYLVPWVASRTLSQTSTSNTVIRIANIGSAAVGRVSAELVTSSTGVTSSTLVPLATSISPRGEVVITSNSLQNAFGADFGRADIRLTVEGAPANLVVRRFVQSTVNGALSEVSLGRSSTDGGLEPVN